LDEAYNNFILKCPNIKDKENKDNLYKFYKKIDCYEKIND